LEQYGGAILLPVKAGKKELNQVDGTGDQERRFASQRMISPARNSDGA